MELAHRTHKASKAAVEDALINMPENVITHILDCLPIKDAVRTGILSRSWRFKWTMISQLVFDLEFFKPDSDDRTNCNERTITRLLHHLKGPVTKFALFIPEYKLLDIEDVSLWVMYLSRRGIKELSILNQHTTQLKLPTYLSSCLDLKFLWLFNCCFHMAPSFSGFPNLMTLGLAMVRFESGNIGEFLTGCPLLKSLTFSYNYATNKELDEIKKLENLKSLCMHFDDPENITITSSGIYELVGSLPKLQEMSLHFRNCKLVAEASAGKQAPTAFPHPKTLTLKGIDFGSIIMLSFALDMIWGSKNLQTLDISATDNDVVPPPLIAMLEAGYSRMEKLNLRSVVFSCFRGSENEVRLIKYILMCSPLLKKIAIHANSSQVFGGETGRVMFATKLLKFQRASTIAEVDINWM